MRKRKFLPVKERELKTRIIHSGTSRMVLWLRIHLAGFLGGSVVKNSLANAGDGSSIPASGRSHMPLSNEAHEPQLLSLCSRGKESQLLKPTPRVHAPQENPP